MDFFDFLEVFPGSEDLEHYPDLGIWDQPVRELDGDLLQFRLKELVLHLWVEAKVGKALAVGEEHVHPEEVCGTLLRELDSSLKHVVADVPLALHRDDLLDEAIACAPGVYGGVLGGWSNGRVLKVDFQDWGGEVLLNLDAQLGLFALLQVFEVVFDYLLGGLFCLLCRGRGCALYRGCLREIGGSRDRRRRDARSVDVMTHFNH